MALSKMELAQFQKHLLSISGRLRGDVDDITDGAFGRDEESRTPTHPAELGSDNYEQDFALDLIHNEQETLKEISSALKRIAAETFGLCEGCVEEGKTGRKALIPKTRLKALPWARNCVECERKREAQYT
jgi:DnaK suppressor protein